MTRIQSLKNQWSENIATPQHYTHTDNGSAFIWDEKPNIYSCIRLITVLLALKNLYERHFRAWKHKLDQKVNYLFFPNSIKILYGPDTAEFKGVFFSPTIMFSLYSHFGCQIWHFIEMLYFRNLVKCLHKPF